jgi:hypothetical protein
MDDIYRTNRLYCLLTKVAMTKYHILTYALRYMDNMILHLNMGISKVSLYVYEENFWF